MLPRLLSAAAPPGTSSRENRRQCLKVSCASSVLILDLLPPSGSLSVAFPHTFTDKTDL